MIQATDVAGLEPAFKMLKGYVGEGIGVCERKLEGNRD